MSMEGACVVPARASAVMTIRGSTFQPWAMMALISGWYLVILFWIVFGENLSFVYVNSINWIVISFVGCNGGVFWYGTPFTQRMSGLNLAVQWHFWVVHVQGRSQGGTVFSSGLLLNVPTFMRIYHLVFWFDSSNLRNV